MPCITVIVATEGMRIVVFALKLHPGFQDFGRYMDDGSSKVAYRARGEMSGDFGNVLAGRQGTLGVFVDTKVDQGPRYFRKRGSLVTICKKSGDRPLFLLYLSQAWQGLCQHITRAARLLRSGWFGRSGPCCDISVSGDEVALEVVFSQYPRYQPKEESVL